MRKIIVLLFFTIIFPQEKTIELKDVMGGTFRYDGIGSYKWANNQDAYYFSDSDSLGKNFYRYDLARDDTTAVFSIKKDQLDHFNYSFNRDQTMLLLKTNNISIWRHSSYGTYHVYDIVKDTVVPVSANPDSLRNVKISPDNQYVSYVRNDNNLYLFSLEDLEEFETIYRLEDGENAPQLIVTSNANQFIYEKIKKIAHDHTCSIIMPPKYMLSDNAAMIGWACIQKYLLNGFSDLYFKANPRLTIKDSI